MEYKPRTTASQAICDFLANNDERANSGTERPLVGLSRRSTAEDPRTLFS